MNRAVQQLEDAARIRRVRSELNAVLRAGMDVPDFAGVNAVSEYLSSGRIEEARAALERLKKELD